MNLQNVLQRDKQQFTRFQTHLRQQGWCIFELPENLATQATSTLQVAESYFDQKKLVKRRDTFEHGMGYHSFGEKEGLTLLTGSFLEDNRFEFLKDIARSLNSICFAIVKTNIFGTNVKGDFPLLQKKNGVSALDVACYYPSEKVHVEAHDDPGLFALNVLSTAPGLELLDRTTNRWVRPPPHSLVMWCGKSARAHGIPPGTHRVVGSKEKRLTCWVEVHTRSQHAREIQYSSKFTPIPNPDSRKIPVTVKSPGLFFSKTEEILSHPLASIAELKTEAIKRLNLSAEEAERLKLVCENRELHLSSLVGLENVSGKVLTFEVNQSKTSSDFGDVSSRRKKFERTGIPMSKSGSSRRKKFEKTGIPMSKSGF